MIALSKEKLLGLGKCQKMFVTVSWSLGEVFKYNLIYLIYRYG